MINKTGLELIKSFEGLRLKAYKNKGDVWTIGWGTTLNVHEGDVITQMQAESFLNRDILDFEKKIRALLTVSVNQNQSAALISFAYNVGVGNLTKSTLLKLVNQGRFEDAAAQFDKWVNANGKPLPGLIKRRQAEKQLFLTKEII